MLKSIFSLLLFFILVQATFAQDCIGYFPFKEDTVYELTSYDKKGEKTVVIHNKIALIEPNGSDFRAVVQSEIKNEKDEELNNNKYEVTCKDGTFYIDATAFINPAAMSAYQSMDMEIIGDGVELPATMSVGQKLKDAITEIQISSNDVNIMKMTFTQENRMVEAEEKLTTPAGTYDCYVISYDTTMKMLVKKVSKTKEWYAAGVGMVRQEIYDKKGNLESYLELTKFVSE